MGLLTWWRKSDVDKARAADAKIEDEARSADAKVADEARAADAQMADAGDKLEPPAEGGVA
jgi:F0F1-type ATP synthase epsilon subunit